MEYLDSLLSYFKYCMLILHVQITSLWRYLRVYDSQLIVADHLFGKISPHHLYSLPEGILPSSDPPCPEIRSLSFSSRHIRTAVPLRPLSTPEPGIWCLAILDAVLCKTEDEGPGVRTLLIRQDYPQESQL